MNPFNFIFPTEVVMGEGRLKELPAVASRYGEKVFLVYDPFLKGSPVLESVKAGLTGKGLAFVEFNDIVPNPRNTAVDAGTALCVGKKCDVVAVIGGGSAIDTAKANALLATNGGRCWDYTERQNEEVRRPTGRGLPLIVVPTTAGTGTEATSFAVINNPTQKRKCTIITPYIYPDVALVDPEIMATIPPMITALTGLDTFAHALEAYISKSATVITDMLALHSIELFSASIRDAVGDGNNMEARAKMALACGMGGAAIGNAGVTLPHAIGQPLGAFTDAPHGGALAACLPQVVAWTLPAAEDRFARVASIMDPERTKNMTLSQKAASLPAILHDLYADLGVDVSFGKYGLKESEVEVLVDLAFNGFQQDINVHPRKIERAELVELVRSCM